MQKREIVVRSPRALDAIAAAAALKLVHVVAARDGELVVVRVDRVRLARPAVGRLAIAHIDAVQLLHHVA